MERAFSLFSLAFKFDNQYLNQHLEFNLVRLRVFFLRALIINYQYYLTLEYFVQFQQSGLQYPLAANQEVAYSVVSESAK